MITQEEIKQLRDKVDERARRFRENLENGSSKNPTDALAALASTDGWDLVRHAMEEMILELLTPEDGEDMTESMYMVSGKSRHLTVHAIESILKNVDAAVAAKVAVVTTEREEDKPEEGVSE